MWRRSVMFCIGGRGPKKGKAKEAVAELSSDVINIFKDRQDPENKDISEYPEWVRTLAQPEEHPLKIADRMYRGEQVQLNAREQRRVSKWIRKLKIAAKNQSTFPKIKISEKYYEDRIEIGPFEGEESEDDPEDHLEPQFRLAIGSPYQKEVDMILERLKANIDKPSN